MQEAGRAPSAGGCPPSSWRLPARPLGSGSSGGAGAHEGASQGPGVRGPPTQPVAPAAAARAGR
eukprot:11117146-Lingulodinium_polyedra.AAC.1